MRPRGHRRGLDGMCQGAEIGAIPAGTRLVSHRAAFYLMGDGLVLEQSSYDCYEPIAS